MIEKLFSYGTLQNPATQRKLLGRELGEGSPDTLRGYRLAQLTGVHAVYPIVQPEPGATVAGLLFEVDPEELARLDTYEGEAYQRLSVRLVSGRRAWVYCANPKSSLRFRIKRAE